MRKIMKKKRNKIVIPADKEHRIGKLQLLEVGDCLYYHNKRSGKRIPKDDLICHLYRSVVSWIFMDKKTTLPHFHINVSIKELENFIRKAKRSEARFKKWDKKRKKEKKPQLNKFFFKHLSPEITFIFTY